MRVTQWLYLHYHEGGRTTGVVSDDPFRDGSSRRERTSVVW